MTMQHSAFSGTKHISSTDARSAAGLATRGQANPPPGPWEAAEQAAKAAKEQGLSAEEQARTKKSPTWT